MAEIYIISKADIQKMHPIADVPQTRLDPYILKAQELDLKPILNEALYQDFITKFKSTGDPMYAAYQALLNGTTYTYSGQTVACAGLIPMLTAFTMARFLPMNQINVTRFSVVTKSNPQSEPVPGAQLTYIVNNLRAEAIAYQEQIERFLLQNQTTYPLYGRYPNNVQQRSSVKLTNTARSSGSRGGRPFGWWNGVWYN
jgi:hypothetical protein